jgi:tyrosyl-tRNA synthetase
MVPRATFDAGVPLVDLLVTAGPAKSKSDARRLIGQGGASVNGTVVANLEAQVTVADLQDDALLLRAGKKRYARVVAEG